jgi:hypothetical protein
MPDHPRTPLSSRVPARPQFNAVPAVWALKGIEGGRSEGDPDPDSGAADLPCIVIRYIEARRSGGATAGEFRTIMLRPNDAREFAYDLLSKTDAADPGE